MFQILLVEDDKKIREGIEDFFKTKSDIELHIAKDGDQGMNMLYENSFDLVLLDIMLPGVDGFTLCRELRRQSDAPIIFLTARGREEDILYGYDLGCDDYIVKPFSLATLYAKVNALLNRSKGMVLGKEIKVGAISMNPRTMQVMANEKEIELAPKEYVILKILMENKEMVVSRDTLIVRIWGYDYDGDERILDNHMKKLRKALGEGGKQIRTVFGKGYKMVDE